MGPSESTCLPRRFDSMDISQQVGVRYSRTCFAQKQTFLVLASIIVCLLSLIIAAMTDVPLPSLARSVAVDGSKVFHWLISQKQISALKHSSNKVVQAAKSLRDDPRLPCPQQELMSTLLHSVESFSICVQVMVMADQKRAKARTDALDSTGFWDLTGVINTYDTVSDPVAAGMISSRIDDFVSDRSGDVFQSKSLENKSVDLDAALAPASSSQLPDTQSPFDDMDDITEQLRAAHLVRDADDYINHGIFPAPSSSASNSNRKSRCRSRKSRFTLRRSTPLIDVTDSLPEPHPDHDAACAPNKLKRILPF